MVVFVDYTNESRGVYFLIDNKSFYASVEALRRKLDPLKVNLVVMSVAIVVFQKNVNWSTFGSVVACALLWDFLYRSERL